MINKIYDGRKRSEKKGQDICCTTWLLTTSSRHASPSESLCTPTSFSSSATTSSGLVTCHLASVRFDGCPTAVVKRSSGVTRSSTRGCSRVLSSATSENDSGGSIVYGRDASVNCNERNMSSSVYCGAEKCQPD